jgi:hypothetical protein
MSLWSRSFLIQSAKNIFSCMQSLCPWSLQHLQKSVHITHPYGVQKFSTQRREDMLHACRKNLKYHFKSHWCSMRSSDIMMQNNSFCQHSYGGMLTKGVHKFCDI